MGLLKQSVDHDHSVVKAHFGMAIAQSDDYKKVLGLNDKDVEKMEDQNKTIVFKVKEIDCRIGVVNVCGCPYDGEWTLMLQCRLNNHKQFGTGGGTTYFTVMPTELHKEVINILKNDKYQVTGGRMTEGYREIGAIECK